MNSLRDIFYPKGKTFVDLSALWWDIACGLREVLVES